MRFGVFLPPFHSFSDPHQVVQLAQQAEQAGWDGIFLWDHMLSEPGIAVADAWITMAAIATATESLLIGAMVTPLPRRRPWVLARQIATLDILSAGRVIVGAGLGDDGWKEFSAFGEVTDPQRRAVMVDESLELLRLFWRGEPVDFSGDAYSVHSPAFLPRPIQREIPIWIAGRWPNRRPIARAARYQGFFPIFPSPEPLVCPDLADIEEIKKGLSMTNSDFELVVRYCLSRAGDPQAEVSRLHAAGVTWILENFGAHDTDTERIFQVVSAGPPSTVHSK
jgi:alkanesulfonate monooxygenase SsuD/methylene tetrahydromethanopterin reductase-like flavin-dependent oxidoreductase (luciferase family)